MNLRFVFLNSRFARRLLIIFLVSAILPLVTVAALTFTSVREQLLLQNQLQQEEEARSVGLAIYERLVLLEEELFLLYSRIPRVDNLSLNQESQAYRDRLNEKFQTVGWIGREVDYVHVLGERKNFNSRAMLDQLSDSNTLSTLYTDRDEDGSMRLFILHSANPKLADREVMVAEIRADYLWSSETLEANKDLCVLGHDNSLLYCSEDTPEILKNNVSGIAAESFSGYVEWSDGVIPPQMVSFWSLFLSRQFDVGDWTVMMSIPRQDILSPISRFQNTFLLVVIITILVVFMLSSSQIRRILTPLQKLTEGINALGDTDFDSKVHIDSNDEFADLADSFNSMGRKLSDQFESLETMAEIDRLILTSQNPENILQVILVRIQRIFHCPYIGIATEDHEGEFTRMLVRAEASADDESINETTIKMTESDRNFLSINNQGVLQELDNRMPTFLRPFAALGVKNCLVLPLFIDDTLSAIVAMGFRKPPENSDRLLLDARNWADRVAVALTNAKWQEKLYLQANYDALTGLPNRPAFRTYLQQALDRAERSGEMVGVLFIDLDRFKLVNDTLGHAAGDEYLRIIGERLSTCIRSADLLARLGGDEFTVVISESSSYHHIKTAISAISEKLLDIISIPIEINGHELRSNASIGVSIYPLDGDNIEALMKNADSAMYHSKAHGGGRYQYFSEKLNEAMGAQLRTESDLRQAIANNAFELYFQPQVNAGNGELLGVEALLRWNHPNGELITPDKFIPLAEESQLIIDIDLWVLNAACKQMRAWQDENRPEVRVAVNLSARFFHRDDIIDHLVSLTRKHGVDVRMLELEITEGTLIREVDSAMMTLNQLTKIGFQLTIDDFGTGYSSLSYLKKLPIHKLKIDRSFVDKCVVDTVDAALVKTIISMAQNLNIECIAEGVETEEQLNFLVAAGCTQIQGYHFSKAISASTFATVYLTD